MEPLAWLVLGAGWLGIMVSAARRRARGPSRWAWVFFAPAAVPLLAGVWIAIHSWADQPLLTVFLGLVFVPSLLLFLRSARQQVSDVLPSDPTWKLSSAQFDYIVWTAIGAPIMLAVLLLSLLVTGGLGTSP